MCLRRLSLWVNSVIKVQASALERLMSTPNYTTPNAQSPPKPQLPKLPKLPKATSPSCLGDFGRWKLGIDWELGVGKLGIVSAVVTPARRDDLLIARRDREHRRLNRRRSDRRHLSTDLVAGHDARSQGNAH